MEAGLWSLVGALLSSAIAGVAIYRRLGAMNKERLEVHYERLINELAKIVEVMGDWDGNVDNLDARNRRIISRMLHLQLDTLVDTIAVEGSNTPRAIAYHCRIGRLFYRKLGYKCFIEKDRFIRFSNWYAGTSILYNRILEKGNYIEEVFHPVAIESDPHYQIKSLQEYFLARHAREKTLNKEYDLSIRHRGRITKSDSLYQYIA